MVYALLANVVTATRFHSKNHSHFSSFRQRMCPSQNTTVILTSQCLRGWSLCPDGTLHAQTQRRRYIFLNLIRSSLFHLAEVPCLSDRRLLRLANLLVLWVFAAISIAGQQSIPFHAGQSVYIVSVRGNLGDPSLSTLDLATEKELREGFKKRGVFEIAPSLSKADFVFLCVTEYLDDKPSSLLRNVLAIAVKPDDFSANRSDLTRLRDLALWQSSRSAKVRVKLKSVMEDFHDFAAKK